MSKAVESEMERSIDAAITLISGAERLLVACHRRPDGDALGSALGLAAGLRALGKNVTVYCPDSVPRSLQFLLAEQTVVTELKGQESFSATLVMDAAAPALLPEPFPEKEMSGAVIVFDHHVAGEDFGDLMVRDSNACATGAVVLRVLRKMGLTRIPRLCAVPLYAAICADTGGFRYANTDSATLRAAADLLDAGADPWEAAYNLFEGWEPEQVVLLRRALESMKIVHDGTVALFEVSTELMRSIGAVDEMVDGLVNYGRRVRGVEVAALLWERPELDGEPRTKVSFRSHGRVDVSALAKEFGGGGHRLAAAALTPGSIETLLPRVTALATASVDKEC